MLNKEKLRELRENKGLSTAALGEAVGCSGAMITYIEQGKKEPSAKLLYFIARELGVSMDELCCD